MDEKKLGDQFDIRAFHETVLNQETIPLEILVAKVKRCVSEVEE